MGLSVEGATRTLDSHASRLRRKLAVGRMVFIINVWGIGYRLIDGEVPSMPRPAPTARCHREAGRRSGVG